MPFTAEIIRSMAQAIYGIELSEARAAEIAAEASVLTDAAQRAGRESGFDDELLSARQVLARAAKEAAMS